MSLLSKRRLLGASVLLVGAIAVITVYLQLRPLPITSVRVLFNSLMGTSVAAPAAQVLERLRAPPGFSVTIYAEGVPNARFLRFTAGGDLLVSSPRAGAVQLLERDRNGDGKSDGRRVLLQGLSRPHGLDIDQGWLYIGESTAIGRVRLDEERGRLDGNYEQIVTGLSGSGGHWTKTVRIGPDGYLYLAQGSSCNVCEEKDGRRATIMRFQRDGSGGEIYASGLRNSVGMDWAPWDQALYATDNGRDMLGDDFPPCELNRIEAGGFYGWPYLNGFGVPDPDFAAKAVSADQQQRVKNAIAPAFGFRAHTAPLGIRFVRNSAPPPGYERAALVALHGSWNRSVPDGYKVVSLHWSADGKIEQRDFLTGFEQRGNVIGRPVDVAEGPDGAWYISDDYAQAVYRVSYGAAPAVAASAPTPAAQQPAVDAELAALEPAQRRQLEQQGAQLFKRYACANCHVQGAAAGFRTVRPLEQLQARYSMAQLQAFLVTPTPPMPVFPLNEEERRALAVYLLSR
jgi:glucose/arabinose dehydrogenase